MANNVSQELKRTFSSILQWAGFAGFQIKDSAVTAQFRNATDAGWADIEVKDAKIHGANATFKATLTVDTLPSDITVKLPSGGQVISPVKLVSFNQATTSPLTIDADPPINGTLDEIIIAIDTAAAAGSPTIEVKYSGGATLVATTETSVKEAGLYIFRPFSSLGATPADITLVIVASGQTFTGRVALRYIL